MGKLSIMGPASTATPLGVAINGPTPVPDAPGTPFAATKLGIGANTIGGLLGNVPIQENPYPKVAKDIGQGIATRVAQVGLTAQNAALSAAAPTKSTPLSIAINGPVPTKTGTLAQPTLQIPEYLRPIFGADTNTIKDIPAAAQVYADRIKTDPFAKKLGLDKAAVPLGYGLLAAGTALDLSGLGGEKGAIEALAKETDPAAVIDTLRKIGINQDIAEKFAPDIAVARTPVDVQSLLDLARGSHGLSVISDAEKANTPGLRAPAQTAEEAANVYHKEVLQPAKDIGQAQVIGADDLKDYFGKDYNVANHPVYSKAANDLLFKAASEHDNPTVLFTAGGTGAGKSELIARTIAPNFDGVVYDSTLLNYDGAVKQIRDLREMGKNVEIRAVVRDPETAYAFTKMREANGGHPVSDKAFVNSHSQVNENLIRLAEEHDVPIKVLDVRGITDPAQIQALKYASDPIAVLEDSRYTEGDVRNTISKYQPATPARANARNEEGALPAAARDGQDRAGQGNPAGEGGRVLRGEPVKGEGQFPSTEPFPSTPETKIEEQLAKSDPSATQAFDEPLGMPAEGSIGKSAGTAIKDLGNGKDGGSWKSLLRAYFANAPKVKTANIMSYLATPEFELERLGLSKGAEMLQAAKDEAIDLRNEFLNKVISWKSEVSALKGDSAAANTRIFRYLDGKARFVTKEMSPEELRVAGEVKAWLKELADRLNIPEEGRISEYITHIFERSSEVNPQESVFDDPEMIAIMDQPAKSVYNPFLQARLGKPTYKEDTWGALDAYAKRAARKIAMDPALERVATDAKKLDGAAYQYVSTMTHNINMRPQHIDTLIDNFLKETPGIGNRFGDRPVAAITKATRRVFSRGIFGLNFRNALNNLSQGANTYAKLGEKYTTVGYTKLLGRMLTGNLEDLYKSHVLDEQFVEQDKKLGVYKTALQRLDPKLFVMQRASELINRGAAYYGAEARGLAKGLSPEDAIKYAKRIVRETQFSFDAVDVPVGLNSDLAKTLTQTLSYNVKQTEFLKRMVADKDFAGLIRYSLANIVFLQTVGTLYGLTLQQMLPTIGFGGNPTLAVLKDISDLTFGTVQTKATAVSDLKTRVAQLFPAGGQIKKTVSGISAYEKGRDVTPTGKTRFKIPHTMANLLRISLFGKSSLPQAQAYYDKLDNPKKAKTVKTKLGI